MRVRKLWFRLVLPGILIALVLLLATLQYQWLGKVSDAERAQMLRSLTQRAREFAEDFDGEMTLAYRAHQISRDAVVNARLDGLVESMTRWRSESKFPQMVRAVYLAERANADFTLRALSQDRRTFEKTPLLEWPSHLEPVRRQLTGTTLPSGAQAGGKAQFISLALMPALPDVPALIVPVLIQGSTGSSTVTAGAVPFTRSVSTLLRSIDACIVVDLDAAYLGSTVLPAMAARHFPDLGANGYRMAVVSSTGATLFARDVPAGQSLNPDRADVTQSFFSVRPDLLRTGPAGGNTLIVQSVVSPTSEGMTHASPAVPNPADRVSVFFEQRSPAPTVTPDPASSRIAGRSTGQFRIMLPSWRIVLQHPSGSLDAAVSQARRRNLGLSFGILGVLTAGLVIVIVNARRAEQLAARRMDFVATVSHELRTPLAVIRSAAQNLSAGVVSEPAHAKRYGELIDGEGRRLTDMVEQVMTLAGLESGKPLQGLRQVDIPALVDDVVNSCGPLCEAAGIAVEVNVAEDADMPPVMADEAALTRAIENLVTNAVKHGADGKWIGVSVSAPHVRRGREVQVVIADRGRGIDAADLPHLFEPFHRGRHAIEQQIHGNGLGLHLVKLIASAHGGKVTVQSTPGRGAVFTLHLPVAQDDSNPKT